MDPINPFDGLAELLRRRVANEGSVKGKAPGAKDVARTHASEQRTSPEALRRKIEHAIEGIDPDDPARGKKAARLFVENVLTWQFGEALINDPGFAALVEEVQTTLELAPGFGETLLGFVLREHEKK